MAVSPSSPDWVQDAVFYQIFPDRFRNGDPANDPSNVHPWGAPPASRAFFGGDLAGVIEKLPYLRDLGVNALYFNPIFAAFSTHRYDAYDYFRIDPHLGDLGTFRDLTRLAHQHGMHVILDGVFNHCGRGFFAFQDILENGPDSPFLDWFHIHRFPLNAYDEGAPPNYTCWWNFRALPKFNTGNPAVRQYLFAVARYWLEQGADGWRLDVPNEIGDSFWQEFRAVVRETNPEAYLVGEIWHDGQPWLQGDQFDGITHYELRTLLLDWLVEDKHRSRAFAHRLQAILDKYRPETLQAQLNVLGSHDTPRLMTAARDRVDTVKLLWLFVMTWPGAPCIYYGDEIGLTGGSDPECRNCFPWDETAWNQDLRSYIQRLIALRKELPALRRGATRILLAPSRQNLFAHGRGEGPQAAVAALNASDVPCTFDIPLSGMAVPDGTMLVDRFHGERYLVRGSRLEAVSLPPRSGTILVRVT
jgi:cyclomaltodextrinase